MVAAGGLTHVNITVQYTLENFVSDRDASFYLHPNRIFLINLFEAGLGPNRCKLDKKGKMMQALADRAKSDIEKHKNELLALQGPTDTVHFEDPSKKRKLEALKMAREAAAKKPKPVMRALTFAPA